MAKTFDTPIVVTEVASERYRLYRGGGVPSGIPHREPTSLASLYQVSGPLEAYYRLAPPQHDMSRDEVLAWLQSARMLGCRVQEVAGMVGSAR